MLKVDTLGMRKSFFRGALALGTVIFLSFTLFLPETHAVASSSEDTASSTSTGSNFVPPEEITSEEIRSFLFRIQEGVKEKVLSLSGDSEIPLRVPILFDMSVTELQDTWGDTRSGGRSHEGTDIIVPRGSLIVTPTNAVVTNVGYDSRGGNYVLTANPGGEQFYYAHLNEIADGVVPGKSLERGDLLGYAGNTGNAIRTLPHLHFGIYYKGIAQNPFPRLVLEFSLEERAAVTQKVIDGSNFAAAMALKIIAQNKKSLAEIANAGFALPDTISSLLQDSSLLAKANLLQKELRLNAEGESVRLLQNLLISEGSGPYARSLAGVGATGLFGPLTKNALIEYQKINNISPASGNFDPLTRNHILNALALGTTSKALAETAPSDNGQIDLVAEINRDLEVGAKGTDVKWLQEFLISANIGGATRKLSETGVTGYFGRITKNALAEYQKTFGIKPASGYFGPITRNWIRENIKSDPSGITQAGF